MQGIIRTAAAGCAAAIITITGTACSGTGGPPTPASVARQIGATGLHHADTGPYASGAAYATWHGKPVEIATFTSGQAQTGYIKATREIGSMFGIPGGPRLLIRGDRYVVYSQ